MYRQFDLAVDIEKLGPVMKLHPITEIAGRIIDHETGELSKFHDKNTFKVFIYCPTKPNVDERCLVEHWLKPENVEYYRFTLEQIQDPTKSVPIATAAQMFIEWARSNLNHHPNVVIVTDTCGFDIGHIDLLLCTQMTCLSYLLLDADGNKRYTKSVDVDSFAAGIASTRMPKEGSNRPYEDAFDALDVPMPEFAGTITHRSEDDAAFIGSLFAKLSIAAKQKREKELVSETN